MVFYHRSELYFITTPYMYSKQQQQTLPPTKYQLYWVMQRSKIVLVNEVMTITLKISYDADFKKAALITMDDARI